MTIGCRHAGHPPGLRCFRVHPRHSTSTLPLNLRLLAVRSSTPANQYSSGTLLLELVVQDQQDTARPDAHAQFRAPYTTRRIIACLLESRVQRIAQRRPARSNSGESGIGPQTDAVHSQESPLPSVGRVRRAPLLSVFQRQ